MDGSRLSSALFCEQCGLDRDSLGDESIASFRECPSCARAVCPNCWNLVRAACLRCAPFSLATRPQGTVVPLSAVAPAVFAVDAAPAAARTSKLPRRGKGSKAAAAAVVTARAAGTGGAAPVAARKPAPISPPVEREVSWPVRPGSTAIDAPWPSMGSAPQPIKAPVRPNRVTARRRGRSGGFAAATGMVVVLVALFGVAGLALAAFGRLPAAGQRGHPPATQTPTQPDGSAPGSAPIVALPTGGTTTDPVSTGVPDTTGTSGPGGTTGGPGTPGTHGAPGATVRPDGSTPRPITTPGATATATPTATPTAEPTPTPTPEPTEAPTPTPTPPPDPTPEPTGAPTPTPTPPPDPDPTPTNAPQPEHDTSWHSPRLPSKDGR
jgi:hypothetical protein